MPKVTRHFAWLVFAAVFTAASVAAQPTTCEEEMPKPCAVDLPPRGGDPTKVFNAGVEAMRCGTSRQVVESLVALQALNEDARRRSDRSADFPCLEDALRRLSSRPLKHQATICNDVDLGVVSATESDASTYLQQTTPVVLGVGEPLQDVRVSEKDGTCERYVYLGTDETTDLELRLDLRGKKIVKFRSANGTERQRELTQASEPVCLGLVVHHPADARDRELVLATSPLPLQDRYCLPFEPELSWRDSEDPITVPAGVDEFTPEPPALTPDPPRRMYHVGVAMRAEWLVPDGANGTMLVLGSLKDPRWRVELGFGGFAQGGLIHAGALWRPFGWLEAGVFVEPLLARVDFETEDGGVDNVGAFGVYPGLAAKMFPFGEILALVVSGGYFVLQEHSEFDGAIDTRFWMVGVGLQGDWAL